MLGSWTWTGIGAIALGVAYVGACSASAGSADGDGNGGTGTGSTNGAGGNLFETGGDNGGGFGNVVGNGSTTGMGGNASCNSEVHEGERAPLDLYFILDKSGSMNEDVTGGTKWSTVTGALISFLQDPANADIGSGIEFFPSVDPNAPTTCQTTADCTNAAGNYGTCTGPNLFGFCLFCYCSLADACLTGAYVPAVPLALPPNPGPVVAAIQGMGPGGGTPTRPALEGGMSYATQWASQHPDRTTVIVLATDGDPTGCQTNSVQDVANIAANGFSQSNIRTFVIGVGSSLTALNQVAQAGGTNQAYVLDTGGDVAKAFADALASIYGEAASCDFKVPEKNTDGTPINRQQVNVQFTPKGGAAGQLLRTYSGTAADCGTDPGWYADNPDSPTVISMCPASCDALKAGGRVEVALGCQPTQHKPK
ncbi:MAG TPA: VWA domain-containing protein [Polyangiaceae bacterium]|nr:VWA domain-containing protein [Polyangiaceae bacterium]